MATTNGSGTGTFDLTGSGSTGAFVSKYDPSGHFLWASGLGGNQSARGIGLAVDPAGDVFSVGQFGGTADFDPGPYTTDPVASRGGNDGYLSKLTQSSTFAVAPQARYCRRASASRSWPTCSTPCSR